MLTGVEIIGLVSAVITFIDFAAENVAVAREIGKSGSAAVKGNADLERRVKLLDERIKNVYSCGLGSARDVHEAELLKLVDRYKDLAVQLLSLLDGLKSTRKRDVLFKSAKNVLKKGQKESLVQDLDECRTAIHHQLTQVMRQDMNRRLDEISGQGHNQIAELRQLRTSTEALESSLGNWQQVPGLAEEVRTIVRQASDAIDRNARKQVLKELWIEGMQNRFEEVDEAHESTFHWILGNDSSSSEEDGPLDDDGYHSEDVGQRSSPGTDGSSPYDDKNDQGENDDDDRETPEEVQARQKIVNWLTNEHGIFHITGKPGSGKSTLMKYLCQNAQTQEYLQSWAGDKTLLTANFFFWRPGTTIQKSLDGLRRALLYTIMDEIPSLVQVGFPKQWALAVEDRPCQIRGRDVEAALKLVLDQSDLWAAHKVAFFIDGLDEFEGDHDHMMKLLLRWVREHKDSVKLCVSSREWEIFRQRLAGCPGIRLQDITVRDIRSYVSQELSENEEFERFALTSPEILGLVDQITAKAEGVFLWVKITLRGLKHGLLSGERVEDLEERINGLPTELEDLYQSLFDSMKNGRHTNKLDRAKAMQTLLLALLHAHIDGEKHFRPPFLLISYSFLDDYTRDQDFAQKMAIQPIDKAVCNTRLDDARKMIYQRCMGFLETYMIPVEYHQHRNIAGETHQSQSTDVTGDQRNGMPSSGETGDNDSDDDSRSITSNVKVLSQGTEDHGSAAFNGQRISAVEDDRESAASSRYADYLGREGLIVDQINSRYPVRHGIRFIHRTALEFLSQPSVSRQIRDAAVQFNEADFELQAIIASMKLFAPCARYAKGDFITNLRYRLSHYLSRMVPISEALFLRFQGEASRILRHYDLTVGCGLGRILSVTLYIEIATDFTLLDPEDSLLLLAVRTGASHGLSSLTGHELSRRLQYDNRSKDIVLDTYLQGMEGLFSNNWSFFAEQSMSREDRVAYGQRIYRDVAAYLETGASPNSVSHYEVDQTTKPALTCWQLWVLCLLSWEDLDNFCERFLELFLLHGADANFWFRFGSQPRVYAREFTWPRVWWPALRDISLSSQIREDDMSKVASFLEEAEADENSEGRAISLGEFLLTLFPQTGARLKELADRNLGSEASPPPEEVWAPWEKSVLDTDSWSSSRSRSSSHDPGGHGTTGSSSYHVTR